jgi:hypothetical protein
MGHAMNQLVSISPSVVSKLVAVAGERAGTRFLEFFCRQHSQSWRCALHQSYIYTY